MKSSLKDSHYILWQLFFALNVLHLTQDQEHVGQGKKYTIDFKVFTDSL